MLSTNSTPEVAGGRLRRRLSRWWSILAFVAATALPSCADHVPDDQAPEVGDTDDTAGGADFEAGETGLSPEPTLRASGPAAAAATMTSSRFRLVGHAGLAPHRSMSDRFILTGGL